jgi:3-hydroxyacyl-[acyl-carrier-protein] dehydratase
MRFLLVDKVVSIETGKSIQGVKCWSLDNEIFRDHFPGAPVVPGVLLVESVAQLLGILIEKSFNKRFNDPDKVFPLLSIIQKAKFRSIVRPGDQCEIHAELKSMKEMKATGRGYIMVDGRKIMDVTLNFIVPKEKDIGYNPFIKKREEYVYNITKVIRNNALITASCKSEAKRKIETKVLEEDGSAAILGALEPDKESEFYPERSDTKLMRNDIIESIIGLSGLMKELGISEKQRESLGLFIANGVFLENADTFVTSLTKAFSNPSIENRLGAVYKYTPPLLALETLTNSSMSFIAKYLSVKGYNITYGNTSASGFAALEDAIRYIKNEKSAACIVGASNCGGIYSNLMFRKFYISTEGWHESAGTAFFMLENSQNQTLIGKPKVKFIHTSNSVHIPSILHKSKQRFHLDIVKKGPEIDHLILSGPFTSGENGRLVDHFSDAGYSCQSRFGKTGNQGPVNIFSGVLEGIELLQRKSLNRVGILDIDPYQRASYICIERLDYEYR